MLSNIYLDELDQTMATKITEFNRGKERVLKRDYDRLRQAVKRAKQKARATGDWTRYKALKQQMLNTEAKDPMDPDYRRMYYVRYADDFLVGINGRKTEAEALKIWLGDYLSSELQLELSQEKTLVTSAKERVRFLGYDIKRWSGTRILRYPTTQGVKTRRTGTYQLSLLMPPDKTTAFAREYGNPNTWHGEHRSKLLNLSELEILLTYNAEVRGFLGYYSLADKLKDGAGGVLWMTARSFFCTLAAKRQSSVKKVMKSLKKGPGRYAITLEKEGKGIKEYELIASTKHLKRETITYGQIDLIPKTWMYQSVNFGIP